MQWRFEKNWCMLVVDCLYRMSLLTDTDRHLLDEDSLRPIPKIDEQTQRPFFVVSAAFVERIEPLMPESSFEPRDLAPQISKTASAAGWTDPLMDAYDHYDAHATPR